MEKVFRMTIFWTWDSRGGGKQSGDALVTHVRDDPYSPHDQWNNNNLIQLPLLLDSKTNSWYLRCFSVIVACRLWVNGIVISMKRASLFVSSVLLRLARWNEQTCPLIKDDPSRVCNCFPGRPATHICNMENMVPQEDETDSPIPDGKLWRPGYVGVCQYFELVLDKRQSQTLCFCTVYCDTIM